MQIIFYFIYIIYNVYNIIFLGCTALGSDCMCDIQSDEVCSNVVTNSECNYETGACQCEAGFTQNGVNCVLDQNSVVSDGSSLGSFSSPAGGSPTIWKVATGPDAKNDNLNILHNQRYLAAESQVTRRMCHKFSQITPIMKVTLHVYL